MTPRFGLREKKAFGNAVAAMKRNMGAFSASHPRASVASRNCGKLGRKAMDFERATTFNTPTADSPALAEAVHRLVEAYQPERIYLFGSVARGDAGPDSDYDLLVVVPDNAQVERRRSHLAYMA